MKLGRVPPGLALHAIVAAGNASRCVTMRGVHTVTSGPLTALASRAAPASDPLPEALRHDRIVRLALDRCDAVVPFRAGAVLQSAPAVEQFLCANAGVLDAQLGRFAQRVEMGLKAALVGAAQCQGDGATFDQWVATTLQGLAVERQERLRATQSCLLFEGVYLVRRNAVREFWAVLAEARRRYPSVPVVGSGPWAPYGFCDFALAA